MKKRLIGVVTVILILLVCNASTASAVSTSAGMDGIPLPEEYDEEFFATQWESIGIYDKMLDSFQADAAAYNSSGAVEGSEVYPDYYGGSYIDDSGKLVVLSTDMSGAVISEIRAAAGYDVAVAPCPASRNKLYGIVDTFVDHCELLREQGVRISSFGPEIRTGKVTVSVINLDAEQEAKIRALVDVDYKYVEFRNVDRGWVPQAALRAGAKITNQKTGTNGTLGFPAVNSEGVKGFVTAGHVAPGRFQIIT